MARKQVGILGREAPAPLEWPLLSTGPGPLFRAHLSWAILSAVTFTMAWIRSSLLASSFFFISLVSLWRDRHRGDVGVGGRATCFVGA